MRLSDLTGHLDALAPPHTAEAWDNVGLIVGDPAADVTRAVLCIDYTAAVAAEAKTAGAQLVIAYHPPLFKPTKTLTADGPAGLVFDAVRRGVAVYTPHTALDVAAGGTNDVLAGVVGLTDVRPVRPATAGAVTGMGRVGRFERPVAVLELFDRIKAELGVGHLLVAGPVDRVAITGVVCAGSCGEFLKDVLATKADVYVTGEARHHDALAVAAAGMTLVCTLHSHSERMTLRHLAGRLTAELPGVTWTLAASDADPFTVR